MENSILSLMFPLQGLVKLVKNSTDTESSLLNLEELDKQATMPRSLILFSDNTFVKTSIQFQACLSAVLVKREVIYISKEKLKRMPMHVHNMPRVEVGDLNLIKFIYLKTSDEIINYLSRIQVEAKMPALILIDNLTDFIDPSVHDKELDRMNIVASVCAQLQSALAFINSIQFCVSILSIQPIDSDDFFKIYFDSSAYLKAIEEDSKYEIVYLRTDSNAKARLEIQVKDAAGIFLDRVSVEESSFY